MAVSYFVTRARRSLHQNLCDEFKGWFGAGPRSAALNLQVVSVAICTGARADQPPTQSSDASQNLVAPETLCKFSKILCFSVMKKCSVWGANSKHVKFNAPAVNGLRRAGRAHRNARNPLYYKYLATIGLPVHSLFPNRSRWGPNATVRVASVPHAFCLRTLTFSG
jgi:hypothetical protein